STHMVMLTELLLATAGVLRSYQPNPGREVPSRSESFRIGNAGNKRGRQGRPNTWYLIQPLTRLIGPMPGHDASIASRICASASELRAESGNAVARGFRHAIIIRISRNIRAVPPCRCARPAPQCQAPQNAP